MKTALFADLRYAVRFLAGKQRGMAIIAVLSAAFPIGVNVTLFSIADAIRGSRRFRRDSWLVV